MDPCGSQRIGRECHAALFPVKEETKPRGTGLVLESDPILRGQIERKRVAPGATESHQNTRNSDYTPEGQPATPRTRSEVASATPGATPGANVPTPSNEGGQDRPQE